MRDILYYICTLILKKKKHTKRYFLRYTEEIYSSLVKIVITNNKIRIALQKYKPPIPIHLIIMRNIFANTIILLSSI